MNWRIEAAEDQREIKRKKRVIEYAEKNGNIKTACRRFGIARERLLSIRRHSGSNRRVATYRVIGD